MHPAAIVERAARRGLHLVALADHNAAANVAATARAGRRAGVAVVPGMEVTSEEEVHVLALLPEAAAAEQLAASVHRVLPGRNDPARFGDQVVVDEHGEVQGFDDHLLIGATTWRLETVVRAIHDLGGLAVAAHVDRERFGLLGQLGFVPAGLALDGVEVSARLALDEGRRRFGALGVPVVTGSDAHRLDEIGAAVTLVLADTPTFGELAQAFRDANGRTILGGGRPMEDLALHLLDIAHNALEAGATRLELAITEDLERDRLTIEVCDNGPGLPADAASRAADPFFTTRTTRPVGMGLSLLAAAARAAGGALHLESTPGVGTRVTATFERSHVDRQPLGDLEATLLALMAGHPEVDIRFRHRVGSRQFELSSRAIAAERPDRWLQSPEGLRHLREAIRAGERSLTREGP
jgi:anti-sigma regulatory factor (Ser/Thr protein kinase)